MGCCESSLQKENPKPIIKKKNPLVFNFPDLDRLCEITKVEYLKDGSTKLTVKKHINIENQPTVLIIWSDKDFYVGRKINMSLYMKKGLVEIF